MFTHKGRTIEKIAVIGSGQIGPDIALYFAKTFAPHGVPVVVVDVSDEALQKGQARTFKKIDRGVESGAFKPDAAEAMKKTLTFTGDYEAARGADFVVEAASEDGTIKGKIFAQLETMCPEDAIFASNSSHMEPEVIFEGIESKQRALVIHYFFPAERNPIVEVVPGRDTAPAVTTWVMGLYEWMGKIPLRVESRYGYAIDPIFEGLFQAAALCVEEGLGTVKEVDTVAREALRLGVGPFTAMNLTGGNPITSHGLDILHEKVMPWFKTPQIMHDAMTTGEPWDVAKRDEEVNVTGEQRRKIGERMLGAYFGLVGEVLDSGIISIADLELGVTTGLVVGGPFRMMNKTGVRESLALVEKYAADHEGFKVADCLVERAERGEPWIIPVILREDLDGITVVTIRRPAAMNSMNAEAIEQLGDMFRVLDDDDSVNAVVLTGFGKKAFVAGADIKFLSTLKTEEDAEAMCHNFQSAIQVIEDMNKPVVCALNGFALGGGCEIAMGCHARIAGNYKLLAGQPEVNLGIIPGAGGSQRMPRIVGFETGGELLRTGRPISSKQALEIKLIDRISEGDLLDDAIALAREISDGKYKPVPMPSGPMDVPDKLPDTDIGHLSRKVDEILCRAILGGGAMTLHDGLLHEAKLFGEVRMTEDAEIGITNFIEKGARSKAEFKHK